MPQGELTVARMCALSHPSRAGYYGHFRALASRQEPTSVRDAIQRIAIEHRFYGYRRIRVELGRERFVNNHKRPARDAAGQSALPEETALRSCHDRAVSLFRALSFRRAVTISSRRVPGCRCGARAADATTTGLSATPVARVGLDPAFSDGEAVAEGCQRLRQIALRHQRVAKLGGATAQYPGAFLVRQCNVSHPDCRATGAYTATPGSSGLNPAMRAAGGRRRKAHLRALRAADRITQRPIPRSSTATRASWCYGRSI
jgi:hypothetical protein